MDLDRRGFGPPWSAFIAIMADKAKQDKIDNFVKITDVDEDRAKFYLESSGWNLEVSRGKNN